MGFSIIRKRRAVLVTGMSSNVITALEENGAIIRRTGSRFWVTIRVFFTRCGVKRTWEGRKLGGIPGDYEAFGKSEITSKVSMFIGVFEFLWVY